MIEINGGFNEVNGLPIQYNIVAVAKISDGEILDVFQTVTPADEAACSYYRSGIAVHVTDLKFYHDTLKPRDIIGMKLSEFKHIQEQYSNLV